MTRLRLEWVSRSEEATRDFGLHLARGLVPPVWVGVSGPLGAGKTRLIQGMARGFGYTGRVRSPSFVLENCYDGPIPIRHQDLYRLEIPDEEMVAGWEEDRRSVFLVEWAERTDEAPERAVEIRISPEGEFERRIELGFRPGAGVIRELALGAAIGTTKTGGEREG